MSWSLASAVYEAAWTVAAPCLALSPRLRRGWSERAFGPSGLGRVHLWMQAASGGEAFLAVEIMRALPEFLPPGARFSVLLTTGTAQGREVLERAGLGASGPDAALSGHPASPLDVRLAYFPFDRPSLQRRILAQTAPRLTVLLETELWPGLFLESRRLGAPLAILNARLSERSLRGYGRAAGFWRCCAPGRVLAISEEDAARYAALFGPERTGVMPNIKFDRVRTGVRTARTGDNPLAGCVPSGAPFLVLGSVRAEEEPDVLAVIQAVRQTRPDVRIGLFPRHMHRVGPWAGLLDRAGIPRVRRSAGSGALAPGAVLLGDVFGELGAAYGLATAAFVGGSLKPLGGQNFLEPLGCGVRPVIGPHWRNFAWIGRDIVTSGLVREVADAAGAVRVLLDDLDRGGAGREDVLRDMENFLAARRGGTATACRFIAERLAGGGAGTSPSGQ